MGFLSGMTSGQYRFTVDGRRIYQLPSLATRDRWPAYLVSDSDTGRIERRLRRTLALSFFVVGPLLSISAIAVVEFPQFGAPWKWLYWIIILIVVPGIAMHATIRLWVLRGVQRVVVTPAELPAFDRRAREMVQLKAMGARALIALVVAGVFMTGLQLDVLIEEGAWWSAFGAAFFGGSTVYLARQLWVLRRAERQEKSAP
jgi:hypothetical protein